MLLCTGAPYCNCAVLIPVFSRRDNFREIVRGGKVHHISFHSWLFGEANYRDFVSRVDAMKDEGYQIRDGNIALTTYHLTSYSQGDYSDTELKFERSRFEIKKGREISEDDFCRVVDWFESLREKYS